MFLANLDRPVLKNLLYLVAGQNKLKHLPVQKFSANPPKTGIGEIFAPLFWSDETKELPLSTMIREVLHHALDMLGLFLGDASI